MGKEEIDLVADISVNEVKLVNNVAAIKEVEVIKNQYNIPSH